MNNQTSDELEFYRSEKAKHWQTFEKERRNYYSFNKNKSWIVRKDNSETGILQNVKDQTVQ